jgi:hypothetical protein
MPQFGHKHMGGEKRRQNKKNTEANLPKEIELQQRNLTNNSKGRMEAVKDIINWKKEKGKSKVINLS